MTEDTLSIRSDISASWGLVKEVRDRVEALVADKGKEIAYASKMTSSELIENALKYGRSGENGDGITFSVHMHDDRIEIVVSNRVELQSDIESAMRHIRQINASSNAQELYRNRLHELMAGSKSGKTQLGLYRIAYEGAFGLSCACTDKMLTITATRKYCLNDQ